MMFGDLALSVITGLAAGAAMYWLYGTARFRAQIGERRLQSSAIVGVAVAVIGFVIRYFGIV